MVDPDIFSCLEHTLPRMLPQMSIPINHGIADSEAGHSQDQPGQSVFIQLLPLLDLQSRTRSAVTVDSVGSIFWDFFRDQMISEGRQIVSFEVKDMTRGFLMGYFDNIRQKDISQAPGLVFVTMFEAQTCLKNTFGDNGGVRRLGQMYGRIKSEVKKQITACRTKKKPFSELLSWLNKSIFAKEAAPVHSNLSLHSPLNLLLKMST